MGSLEENENIVLKNLFSATDQFNQVEQELAIKSQLWLDVKQLREAGTPVEELPQIANDNYMKSYQKDLSILQVELAGLRERYREKWPAVIAQNKKIAKLKETIHVEANKLYGSIAEDAKHAKRKADTFKAKLLETEEAMFALNLARVDYKHLESQAAHAQFIYNIVLEKLKRTDLARNETRNNMHIVDKAEKPLKPIKPRKVLLILMGLVGGMVVAMALAFFVNYLDDSIKSQDDIETYLRLPFLGYIPNIKTNSVVERDLQAHLHPQSNAAEGFRTMRAAVSLVNKSENLKLISVTSTIPSEGKSLVASNLAIVTAQTGLKTLLVDADLRRPSVHKAFQLQSPVGLSSYLTETVHSVDEFIHSTEVPNLEVVCCGAVPTSPSELVGSRRMAQFLNDVNQRYDRVILDCPPISAVSDPLVIASLSQGVIFVTKFNKIRREHAHKSIQRIQDAGIRIVGVVINDIDFEGKDSYYYSYYYYQNRYYANYYAKDASKGSTSKSKSTKA